MRLITNIVKIVLYIIISPFIILPLIFVWILISPVMIIELFVYSALKLKQFLEDNPDDMMVHPFLLTKEIFGFANIIPKLKLK